MKISVKKSITLVYLNFSAFDYSQISIGLASIFTYLKQNDIKVNIIETFHCNSINEIVNKIKILDDYYIGFSTTELHYKKAIEIAKHSKSADNKIIFGGSFPSLSPEECLQNPFVDFVCVGDGEYTLLELISGLNETLIQGLWFKYEDKIINNGISRIFDVNKFDVTDYSGFSALSICTERIFSGKPRMFAFTWSSRGCPFNCSYCSNNELMSKSTSKLRYRNASNFYKELSFLNDNYNVNNFFLSDENFLANRQHVKQIIENIPFKLQNKIHFGFLSRPEHINYKNIDILNNLVKIGWKWVSIGIEFGNENKRINELNRKHSNRQIITAFKICKELGIHTNAFLITGLYFETINDILITDKLLKDCNPDNVECSIFYPFKGTLLYNYYHKNNLITYNSELSSYFDGISIVHPVFTTNELILISRYWNNWSISSDINVLIRKLTNQVYDKNTSS